MCAVELELVGSTVVVYCQEFGEHFDYFCSQVHSLQYFFPVLKWSSVTSFCHVCRDVHLLKLLPTLLTVPQQEEDMEINSSS